jgi:inorganic pyrophosphatase/exopolyphosphatase
MTKTIITAGSAYVDIDVLASAVGYRELLIALKKPASVVLTGPYNSTITNTVSSWEKDVERKAISSSMENEYILVDISNPNYVEKFVNLDQVTKVFDHHHGYEDFWREKLGENSIIEYVGSCATLIWEEYVKMSCENLISKNVANLLCSAIVSNTLNFSAKITSERDICAYKNLLSKSSLSENWQESYYTDATKTILENLYDSLRTDTKHIDHPEASFYFGQLELWNIPKEEFHSFKKKIENHMDSLYKNKDWLVSVIEISQKRNIFFSNNWEKMSTILNKFTKNCSDGICVSEGVWLRKEILKNLY